MNNLKQITLHNGTILHVGEGIVTCYDPNRSHVELTHGQQKMVIKLAQNLNCQVSMSELYEGYSGSAALVDDKGIRDNVAKMKNTLPGCIKDSVKSVRGYGYKLVGTLEKERNEDTGKGITNVFANVPDTGNSTGRLSELAGDYCGFYLDPLGTGSVLGSYIHIEDAGTPDNPQMTAYAILGIRDKKVLVGNDISQIFRDCTSNYHNSYIEFRRGLSDNDRRCTWLQGSLSLDGNLAAIHLGSNNSHETWTIILNITEYLHCRRDRQKENDRYRGGLGLVLALRSIHGTSCFRLGLVRNTFINHAMIQNNDEIKDRLKLLDDSKDALWKPLKLSGWLDRLWYDWIMNG